MKDSQSQKKKQRTFLKQRGSNIKPKRLRTPERLQKDPEAVEATEEIVAIEEEQILIVEGPEPQEEIKEKQPGKLHNFKVKLAQSFTLFQRKEKIIYKKQDKNREPQTLLKQLETDLQLALIPLILLAILSILMLINNHFLKIIADNQTQKVESIAEMQPFPLAENVVPPDLSAKAAIVLDADSQVVLLSKNPDLRFSMASTTKIMTALTGLDHFKSDTMLTVKSYGVDGSVIGLVPGQQLTFKDLLYAMMLPSANDAAVAIADNYPGGREAFVKKMNEKALLLHLSNTHFADPAGLNDDGNYTTVIDLARLGSYAMKNKEFREVVGTKTKTVYTTSYSAAFPLTNLNKLLGRKGVNGIKTGTTEAAGEVLVTSMEAKGHTFVVVVMNSRDRFADTRELLDFIDEKVTYILPH